MPSMEDNGDQTCVYSWGSTSNFNGHVKKEDLPRIIEIFDTARVIKVACSSTFTLALTANGRVWWWGCRTTQIYSNTRVHSAIPSLVGNLENVFVKEITCTTPGCDTAVGHMACISDKKDLYMWGLNTSFQVGVTSPEYVNDPVKILNNVSDVACGDQHTIIIREGDVYTWGFHDAKSILVLGGTKAVKVDAGGYGFCGALTADHTLYTWAKSSGLSEGNFLGHGDGRLGDFGTPPKPVTKLLNKVKYFACGWIHCGAVTLNGDLYTWGEGDTHRLGHGESFRYDSGRHKHEPTLVKGMEGTHIKKLTLSRGNEGAITEDGDVYTWGGPEHGGHHAHASPTKLELSSTFFQEAEVKDLSCGKCHTVIVLHMRTSLRYLCIRKIAERIDDLMPYVITDCLKLLALTFLRQAPVELREAVASFLDDRRRLSEEQVSRLGIEYSPVKPPPEPPTLMNEMYEDIGDDYYDGEEVEVVIAEGEQEEEEEEEDDEEYFEANDNYAEDVAVEDEMQENEAMDGEGEEGEEYEEEGTGIEEENVEIA